jgi:hypothetical protein
MKSGDLVLEAREGEGRLPCSDHRPDDMSG